MVDTVIERFGGFDTWVNNAGVGADALLEELDGRDHERTSRLGSPTGCSPPLRPPAGVYFAAFASRFEMA